MRRISHVLFSILLPKRALFMKMAELFTSAASFAFISRLSIILFQIATNAVCPDHAAGVFNPPIQNDNNSLLDRVVDFGFGGLRRWDAIYFSHIAQYGYSYENCVAFFPLFPIIVSVFAKIFFHLGIFQPHQSVLVSGVFINWALFSLTACNLYKLSVEVGFDGVIALLSVIIFCLNPANIFMTAPYSESLFMFFLTLSLLYLKRGRYFSASLLIAFSILTRSNGLVGVGFILHFILQRFFNNFASLESGKYFIIGKRHIFLLTKTALTSLVCILVCLFPFLLYQYYIYSLFCLSPSLSSTTAISPELIEYGRLHGYHIVGDAPSPWCFHTVPVSYSYIQAKHWGVGFLKFYEFKQIPNFLLAAPVIALSVRACYHFFRINPTPFYYLGLVGVDNKKKTSPFFKTETYEGSNHGREPAVKIKSRGRSKSFPGPQLVAYVFHLMFLTLFGCCFIHIQVLTRLLFSSSPLLYWYAASALAQSPALVQRLHKLTFQEPRENKVTSCKDRKLSSFSLTGFPFKESQSSSCPSAVQSRRSLKHKEDFENRKRSCQSYNVKSFNIYFEALQTIITHWKYLSLESKAILVYCFVYSLVGTFMFSNFLPWT